MKDKTKEIETLIEKAAAADVASEALHFSQAACNVANAMCSAASALSMSIWDGD